MSHVVHYGSSVFEGLRCYHTPEGPAVFRLTEHLQRFHNSCRVYRMPLSHTVDTLAGAVRAVVSANGLDQCYIRPIALRGYGAAGINPTASPVETYILCWPWGTYLGDDALERGIDVCVSSWRRAAPDTFPMLAKAGGHYVAAQLMKLEAIGNGFAEAIALNVDGLVSEGSGENVFLVVDGTLITPAVDGSLLPGITRDAVLTLARDIGIPVHERSVPRELLYVADEVFLSGTGFQIAPVVEVDGRPVGTGSIGSVVERLQDLYFKAARGGWDEYADWTVTVEVAEAARQ
jgi:branched-chain amino acid aminotransferase